MFKKKLKQQITDVEKQSFNANTARKLVEEHEIMEKLKYPTYEQAIKAFKDDGTIQDIIDNISKRASDGNYDVLYAIPSMKYKYGFNPLEEYKIKSRYLCEYFIQLGFYCTTTNQYTIECKDSNMFTYVSLKIKWRKIQ